MSNIIQPSLIDPAAQPKTLQDLHSIPMLSETECQLIRTEIYELRTDWIRRNLYVPYYTLGAASYLDAAKDAEEYYLKAKHYNELLFDRFAWLYERLEDVLSQHLAAPISYNRRFALPGFHIYLSCAIFGQPLAPVHVDFQYRYLHWNVQETDFTCPISFTLAVSLPQSGGGLSVWDSVLHNHTSSRFQQVVQSRDKVFYPYQVGSVLIHSGRIPHQPAPSSNLTPDDARITLQGHGLFSQGKWQLYW